MAWNQCTVQPGVSAMNASTGQAAIPTMLRRIALALVAAGVTMAGARGAFLLSEQMMNAVALVGAWMMLALLLGYLAVRFRPSVGIPLLAGFGLGAIVVALFAGMGMMG
jgi:hypothetical protein